MTSEAVAWTESVSPEDARGRTREIYDALAARNGRIHNLYRAHSLRPETMESSDLLYQAVLHCADNSFEAWRGELIATWTAALGGCRYAFLNHGANFVADFPDGERGQRILDALWTALPRDEFDEKTLALLDYAEKLTLHPQDMNESDISALRDAGVDEGEVVEANQICASFNYYVRCLNGLGTVLDEEVGLSFSEQSAKSTREQTGANTGGLESDPS